MALTSFPSERLYYFQHPVHIILCYVLQLQFSITLPNIYVALTCFPSHRLYCFHSIRPGRQYSIMYSSAYSWPRPRSYRPCVSTPVNTETSPRLTSRSSRTPRSTCCVGHQAPPVLSTRNLHNHTDSQTSQRAYLISFTLYMFAANVQYIQEHMFAPVDSSVTKKWGILP
jgi:hypothetical protein